MKHRKPFSVSTVGHPRLMKKNFHVPIYGCKVWIIVTDDIPKEHKKWEHLFGPGPDGDYFALCSRSENNTFALFFRRDVLTLSIITHEVFHLTHRIMEWASVHFDCDHHEQGALLNAYLMETVCMALKTTKNR